MIDGDFGTIPYRGYLYGDAAPIEQQPYFREILARSTDELEQVRTIAELLKLGDFSVVDKLVPLLRSKSSDVMLYSAQLLADICTHDQVHYLRFPFERPLDWGEIQTLILFLGQTMSLEAIPILLQMRLDYEEGDFDGYIYTALHTILPLKEVNEYNLGEIDTFELYRLATKDLDSRQYYYRGKPIFIGDLTKEIIVAAGSAYGEKTQFNLFLEPIIVSDFFGLKCPVSFRQPVTDEVFKNLLEHTKMIAGISWTKGRKYFYKFPIGI